MKIILLMMAINLNIYAKNSILTEEQLKLDKNFPVHRKILQACLKGVSSPDPHIGCVAALGYIAELCKLQRTVDIQNTYLTRQEIYFKQACTLSEEAYTGKGIAFFDLDGKTCRKGFETLGERLVSLHKSKDFIDEEYFYWYEKKSCKEFRRYVYFCEFIDGGLRSSIPKNNKLLPKIDFTTNQNEYCMNKNDGISMIGKDLLGDRKTYNENIYEKAILAGRSRMPSSNSMSKDCEQIRNSYNNFSCLRFEKVDLEKDDHMPGEKPIRTVEEALGLTKAKDDKAK